MIPAPNFNCSEQFYTILSVVTSTHTDTGIKMYWYQTMVHNFYILLLYIQILSGLPLSFVLCNIFHWCTYLCVLFLSLYLVNLLYLLVSFCDVFPWLIPVNGCFWMHLAMWQSCFCDLLTPASLCGKLLSFSFHLFIGLIVCLLTRLIIKKLLMDFHECDKLKG